MAYRIARVAEEIKKEISDIVKNEIRDPRLPAMFSVMEVEVSKDFSYAKVFYSLLAAKPQEEKDAEAALRGAAGYVRRLLGDRLKLRRVPELRFVQDRSIERVVNINKLIDETMRADAQAEAASESENEA